MESSSIPRRHAQQNVEDEMDLNDESMESEDESFGNLSLDYEKEEIEVKTLESCNDPFLTKLCKKLTEFQEVFNHEINEELSFNKPKLADDDKIEVGVEF
ncbi:hypothetical protein L2E82_40044 [Cichorium intybus]|uniref:Uncharacterized protein n=1 Tax=Cichorium intybus TaxID=13427 RepID=A0ACB9AKJ3_CICIN|nr:hypothetical protein L2E82_40044 [Cichorium intybus]